VQIFKPDIDRRFDEGKVISRDNKEGKDCILIPAGDAEYIYAVLEPHTEHVIIDEAQFFLPKLKPIPNLSKEGYTHVQMGIYYYPIVNVIQKLSDSGLKVIVAGLDMDSDRRPFGPMPEIMAIAHEIRKIHAVCEVCHGTAMYSYAKFQKQSQVALGDSEYAAICDDCYLKLQQPGAYLKTIEGDDGRAKNIIAYSK
jgi:thymidine kinase